jgi:hypothetical protein
LVSTILLTSFITRDVALYLHCIWTRCQVDKEEEKEQIEGKE